MGIRILLLELGFAIALARISLASVGTELWTLPASDLLSLEGTGSTPAKGQRVRNVAELIDLYCDGEPKDRFADQGASMVVPARW